MRKKAYLVLIVLAAVYIGITYSIPPDPTALAKYNLTATQSRLISLSFIVPILAIWFVAVYGAARLKEYALLVKERGEGGALRELANGLMVLAIGLPVSSIVQVAFRYFTRSNSGLIPTAVIVNNYLALAIALTSFVLIGRGAKSLVAQTKKSLSSSHLIVTTILLAALAIVYVYLTMHNPNRQIAITSSGRASHYLPDWLLVTTIVVPYIYIWFKGILAAMHIRFYENNVSGHIYRQFLGKLASGIGAIIISQVFLQFLTAVGGSLANWGLTSLLILVYILLIIIAVGYVLVAVGAKKLTRIEEV